MKYIKHLWLSVGLVLSATLFLPLLINSGPGVGVDLPAWTAIGHLLQTEVVPDQRWFIGVLIPSFSAGQEVGTVYSLNLMILWLLNLLMPPDLAAKLPIVLTAIVLSFGFFRVASRLVNPVIAAFGAVLVVLVSGELILQGMWYDILSIGLALLLWSVLQEPEKSWTGKRWLIATLLLGSTVYAHPMGLIAGAIIWAMTVVDLLLRAKTTAMARVAALVAAMLPCALMLGAPQILGLLNHARGAGRSVPIELATGLQRLLEVGDLRFSLGRVAFGMIALLFGGMLLYASSLKRLPRDFLLTISALALATAIIVVEVPLVALVDCCRIPFLGSLASFSDRFTHLWGPLVILLFCVLLGRCVSNVQPTGRLEQSRRAIASSILWAALFLSFFLAKDLMRSPFQLTLGTIRERTELVAVWTWLNSNAVDASAYVCLEPTFKGYQISGDGGWTGVTTSRTHVLSLTPLFVPRVRQIGGSIFGSEFNKQYAGESGSFLGISAKSGADAAAAVADRIQRLQCGYAVAHSESVHKLLSEVASLQLVFQAGALAVYRNNSLAESMDLAPRVIARDSQQYQLIYPGGVLKSVLLPIAYSERWSATLSGASVPIDKEQGLMRLRLPVESQARGGELIFGPDRRRSASLFLLALGMLVSLIIAALFARIVRAFD